MPFVMDNFFDTVYQGVALWYGLLAAISGFAAYRFLPWQFRCPLPLLLLVTTVLAVRGSGHFYGRFSLGMVVFTLFACLGMYLRARHSNTTFWKQHPYDLIALMCGFIIASWFYEAPMS